MLFITLSSTQNRKILNNASFQHENKLVIIRNNNYFFNNKHRDTILFWILHKNKKQKVYALYLMVLFPKEAPSENLRGLNKHHWKLKLNIQRQWFLFQRQLYHIFSQYGLLYEVQVFKMKDSQLARKVLQEACYYAFVKFYSHFAAKKAKAFLSRNLKLGSQTCKVKKLKKW